MNSGGLTLNYGYMGIVRPFLFRSGLGFGFSGVLVKILENLLLCMGSLETYFEQIQVLCEGIFSEFERTYPFVFNGTHLDLTPSD